MTGYECLLRRPERHMGSRVGRRDQLPLLLLYGLNTRYVIHCDSEESQVWESHVSLQEGPLSSLSSSGSNPEPAVNLSHGTFHSRLKTNLFSKSFPPQFPLPRTDYLVNESVNMNHVLTRTV